MRNRNTKWECLKFGKNLKGFTFKSKGYLIEFQPRTSLIISETCTRIWSIAYREEIIRLWNIQKWAGSDESIVEIVLPVKIYRNDLMATTNRPISMYFPRNNSLNNFSHSIFCIIYINLLLTLLRSLRYFTKSNHRNHRRHIASKAIKTKQKENKKHGKQYWKW